MQQYPRVQSAFTLIETLIFLALFTFISLSLFRTIWQIIQLSDASKEFQVAHLELIRAGERIDYLIQTADSVEEAEDNRLTVGISGSSDVVTVFLENHSLMIEYSGQVDALTSSAVSIDQITFTEAKVTDKVARFVGYEMSGHAESGWGNFSLFLRGGSMVKSLINQ